MQAIGSQERFERFEGGHRRAFVVDGTACIEIVAYQGRFEGHRVPQLDGVDGLHIKVPINQHGRLFGIDDAFGIDHRQCNAFDDPCIGEPDAGIEVTGEPFGCPTHVGVMGRHAADAGDADEFFEVFEVLVGVCGGILQGGVTHGGPFQTKEWRIPRVTSTAVAKWVR